MDYFCTPLTSNNAQTACPLVPDDGRPRAAGMPQKPGNGAPARRTTRLLASSPAPTPAAGSTSTARRCARPDARHHTRRMDDALPRAPRHLWPPSAAAKSTKYSAIGSCLALRRAGHARGRDGAGHAGSAFWRPHPIISTERAAQYLAAHHPLDARVLAPRTSLTVTGAHRRNDAFSSSQCTTARVLASIHGHKHQSDAAHVGLTGVSHVGRRIGPTAQGCRRNGATPQGWCAEHQYPHLRRPPLQDVRGAPP
ncbi:hypothetical protein C8J57DRAFT_1360468 [Mycena rebaudengoi]|nr:hypothetical protein C8J57DRAFT_1360468 [Mycena rebaudengoi]